MGEAKRKKSMSEADRLAASFRKGRNIEGMSQFIDALVGHCRENHHAIGGMELEEQAEHMKAVFDRSHLIFGLWKERGRSSYDILPMKGSDRELRDAHAAGQNICMISAFFVQDQAHAEQLATVYAGMSPVEPTSTTAWMLWECLQPGYSEERNESMTRFQQIWNR